MVLSIPQRSEISRGGPGGLSAPPKELNLPDTTRGMNYPVPQRKIYLEVKKVEKVKEGVGVAE
jgi:hypothetical protein